MSKSNTVLMPNYTVESWTYN